MIHAIRTTLHVMTELALKLDMTSYAMPEHPTQKMQHEAAVHLREAVGVWLAYLETDWLSNDTDANSRDKLAEYQSFILPLQLAQKKLPQQTQEAEAIDWAAFKRDFAHYQQARETLVRERPDALRECIADMASFSRAG